MNSLCALFNDITFGSWVFPGRGAVYFKRTAMEDLFKVDLEREGEGTLNHPFCIKPLHDVHDNT